MNAPRTDPRQAVVDRVLAFWPEIVVAARAHGLEPGLLAGLVCQESGGHPEAKRHEPGYRWDYGDDPHEHPRLPPGLSLAQDLELQKWSYGLCQVMGAVAREHGFAGHLAELLDPATNLDLGALHLAAKLRQARGDQRQGLLFYNGGGNQAYPDKVLAWARAFAPSRAVAAALDLTPQPKAEAAPREDAASAPFSPQRTSPPGVPTAKENPMEKMALNLLLPLLAKMLPSLISSVTPALKGVIWTGVQAFKSHAYATPNAVDNVVADALEGLVTGMGLAPMEPQPELSTS